MAKGAKKSLAGALHRHYDAQDFKAKQKVAEENRERRAAALKASQNAPKNKRKAAPTEDPVESRPKGKQRLVEPFDKDDTILLVGEGNFSFTLSLLKAPRNLPPHQILATAYDSEEECYAKYPDARDIVAETRQLAGRDDIVEFGVDAGNLQASKLVTGGAARERKRTNRVLTGDPELDMVQPERTPNQTRRWSKIWFGFPHVGAGHKDETRNVLANQLLLARFIISAAPLLTLGPLPEYAREASKGPQRGSDDESEPEDEPDDEGPEDEGFIPTSSQGVMPFRPPSKAGSLLITIRNAHPYTMWNVPMLAKRLGSMLGPIARTAPPLPKGVPRPRPEGVGKVLGGEGMRLWRSYEFDPLSWPGYAHRRTVGWQEGLSTSNNEDLIGRAKPTTQGRAGKHEGTGECRTYQFGLTFMDPRIKGKGKSKRRKN